MAVVGEAVILAAVQGVQIAMAPVGAAVLLILALISRIRLVFNQETVLLY